MKKTTLFFTLFCSLLASAVVAQPNTTSELSQGAIYKIAVSAPGIYKIDYNTLKDIAGSDLDNADPRTFKLYGNGGGAMPALITSGYDNHEKDLVENPIFVSGESDGSFSGGDYILFYAEGPDKWYFDENARTFSTPANPFSEYNYYFLKIDPGQGKRITTRASASGATHTSTSFSDFVRLEDEKFNLLAEWVLGQGSGQKWFGDQFKNLRSRTYPFDLEGLVLTEPVNFCVSMAARAFDSSTYFKVSAGGTEVRSSNFSSVGHGDSNSPYADDASACGSFNAGSDQVSIKVEYPNFSINSEGWLDYIELNFRRELSMIGDQFFFRDARSVDHSVTEFQLASANSGIEIWDISNPLNASIQAASLSGNRLIFSTETAGSLKEFIAFNKNGAFPAPVEITRIDNQNIHGIGDVDLAIIYHPDFEEATIKLADHRRNLNGFDVAMVRIDHIYNEFASGKKDPVAIRDFVKMLYDRNPEKVRYVLLMGDGSFDYRNIYNKGDDFITLYETENSLHPLTAFPTDDFFALVTQGEGTPSLAGSLDVAVGRLPVSTGEQAMNVVNKIIKYETDPETYRDWRNRMVFVGDDEDGKDHVEPNEEIIETMEEKYPDFNFKKIYLDAFPQVSTPGGQKYPAVNEAIDKAIFQGALVVNYFGHGGPKGWAQERVLKVENIINWENHDKLPLFITATCTFTGYDDPGTKTAGEEVILNPNGGAIGLLSTVRAVYISSNEKLTKAVFNRLFEKNNGNYEPIGEIFRKAKNGSGADNTNNRKFTLIGDPSMHLALPQYDIVTTMINGMSATDTIPDTVRALQKVIVEGVVTDEDGNELTGFNGTIYPVVFDKKESVRTLGQDPGSLVLSFDVQENVLFKGRASVVNGHFKFTFVVPKDINYDYGYGKISYYAENGQKMDASGNYKEIVIGKTDANAIADDTGPEVEVYMNTEDFVFGSITDENPVLLVKLQDDNGINVAGTSIGHDLVAILNDNTQNTYVLNDFYEASIDDFTGGEARYPFSSLEEGQYRIKVTAWDVANNPGEGYTEFVVASSEDVALNHVLNFPNPFVDRTCFMFEHNLAGTPMDVQIQIFTVSGRLVKTLEKSLTPSGYILGQGECISWDGTDDFGDPLARGVYLYRVKLRAMGMASTTREGASEFEKLVILK